MAWGTEQNFQCEYISCGYIFRGAECGSKIPGVWILLVYVVKEVQKHFGGEEGSQEGFGSGILFGQ